MNFQLQLIAHILENRDLLEAKRLGVRADMFDQQHRDYWDILCAYHEQHREVPSPQRFEGMALDYVHQKPSEGLSALIDEVRTQKLAADIEAGLVQLTREVAADPWAARAKLSELAEKIALANSVGASDMVFGEDVAEQIGHLRRIRDNGGLLGYPWPWEVVNRNSTGICPGHVAYIYAREKNRKTFLLVFLTLFYAVTVKLKVLIFTRELTPEELARRIYCFASGMDYSKFVHGELSDDDLEMIEYEAKVLYDSQRIIITDVQDGLDGYRTKIAEVKPDIVLHDYIQAIADDMTKRASEATAVLAQTVGKIVDYHKVTKIPAILIGHANRSGVKGAGYDTSEIAGSDMIARRANYVCRIIVDDTTDRMALLFNASRETKKYLGLTIQASLNEHFGEILSEDALWAADFDAKKAVTGSKEGDGSADKQAAGRAEEPPVWTGPPRRPKRM